MGVLAGLEGPCGGRLAPEIGTEDLTLDLPKDESSLTILRPRRLCSDATTATLFEMWDSSVYSSRIVDADICSHLSRTALRFGDD